VGRELVTHRSIFTQFNGSLHIMNINDICEAVCNFSIA